MFVKTPANPGLDICDIAAVSAAAHAAGAIVVADNTTMTPYGQRPLDLGADVVVAADTKAPNGHSDALFGHVASRDPAIVAAVKEWQNFRLYPRSVRSLAGASRDMGWVATFPRSTETGLTPSRRKNTLIPARQEAFSPVWNGRWKSMAMRQRTFAPK